MTDASTAGSEAPPFDPAGEEASELGRGLFDERMGPGSAMAHLYRGEIHRMKLWRERLDRTTNWAVTVVAAILTWAFTSGDNPHYVVLVAGVALAVFLGIEARRFRGYDMFRSRVRMLQENVFAHALDPSVDLSNREWRRKLAAHYRKPVTTVPFEEAIAHRLRRVYLPLLGLLVAAWLLRVTVFAPGEWPASAAVGVVPGVAVTGVVAGAFVAAAFVAYRPRQWTCEGEIRSADTELLHER